MSMRRTITSTRKPSIGNRTAVPGSCGVQLVQFVIGGEEAKKGQLPFLVSFAYKNSKGQLKNFCGGVLVR